MRKGDVVLGERKLWKWCLCSASQCEQVQGNCDKCQYKWQALKRKKKEQFEMKGEENEKI